MTRTDIPVPQMFQLAYVTRDITRARRTVGTTMKIDEFGAVPATAIDLRIPANSSASLKVEIAWAGRWQIELIEPVSGAVGIYEDGLPADDGVAFHHVGAIVPGTRDDWDRFRATIPDERIAIEGGRSQMRFIYVDERVSLGHYVEFVWMSDAFFAGNPLWRPAQALSGR